jgi:hypothetical protein
MDAWRPDDVMKRIFWEKIGRKNKGENENGNLVKRWKSKTPVRTASDRVAYRTGAEENLVTRR